jgi:DNA-3-methyladenine glycosylase II
VPDRPLTRRSLLAAARALSASDPDLARSVERFGPPPLWAREPGFATIVHLILEQQVSLASAQAAFDRLERALGTITPEGFLSLDDARLRAIGFSRQKAGYGRALATELLDGFDLDSLAALEDDAVRHELVRLHGVGRWTSDVYLTMCLLRPDVWPHGDQALGSAAMEVAGLATRPTWDELATMAERWRPYRAVAARILWHHYLRVRGLPVD